MRVLERQRRILTGSLFLTPCRPPAHWHSPQAISWYDFSQFAVLRGTSPCRSGATPAPVIPRDQDPGEISSRYVDALPSDATFRHSAHNDGSKFLMMNIGNFLVAKGVTSAQEIDRAIVHQKSTGGRLGDSLVALGKNRSMKFLPMHPKFRRPQPAQASTRCFCSSSRSRACTRTI